MIEQPRQVQTSSAIAKKVKKRKIECPRKLETKSKDKVHLERRDVIGFQGTMRGEGQSGQKTTSAGIKENKNARRTKMSKSKKLSPGSARSGDASVGKGTKRKSSENK